MPQQPTQQPPIGSDATALMPAVGADVSHLMGAETTPAAPATTEQPSGGVSGFAREFWQRANPVGWIEGLIEAAKRPDKAAFNMIRAEPQFLVDAKEAADKGDYLKATRKVLSYLSMGLGPELDKQADLLEQGRYAEGAGAMAGTATQFVAPEAVARTVTAVRGMRPSNPAVQEAVAFGKREGVPLDAATATDNAAVRAAQHLSDRSLGGAQVAGRAAQTQAEGLATVGERLAARSHPSAMAPEVAGQGVRDTLTKKVQDAHASANTAYTRLRNVEAGHPTEFVDLRSVKAAVLPIYQQLKREGELVPLQGPKGKALTALDRIVTADDLAPLSVADAALSDLKAMARGADMPELRNFAQGTAAHVVGKLDAEVRAAAARMGPDAALALQLGRAATKAKYATAEVLDTLSAEPRRVFDLLTTRKDAALERLRAVQREAPSEMPKIARAYLDELLQRATSEGAFAHADALFAEWQKLGPQTKAILFRDPAHVRDLNNFFLLAKQTAKNANPSGTAHAVAMLAQGSQLFNPLALVGSVVGTASLSKFLHSQGGVRLLTDGFRMRSKLAQQTWIERVRKFAAGQGAVLASQSATAGQ